MKTVSSLLDNWVTFIQDSFVKAWLGVVGQINYRSEILDL